jgi:hypothetical protein
MWKGSVVLFLERHPAAEKETSLKKKKKKETTVKGNRVLDQVSGGVTPRKQCPPGNFFRRGIKVHDYV